ncbi:MAG: PorV/PorQ family protein [candidate division Zixibacteria bacterium]|nr:PorV/PorQ family protein [candidate division Zixibacteria bacterium]
MVKRQTVTASIIIAILIIHSIAFGFNIFPSLGGTKSGTAGMTFLKIGVGARSAALAGAYSATCTDIYSLYHNPAGLAWSEQNGAAFSYRSWVSELHHNFVGVARHINENNVLGLSLITLTTDPMPVTDEYHPTGTGETIEYADFAAGVSYSTKLTDYFSCGLTLKYAQENIGDLRLKTVLIDLGTLYQTDFYGTRFAINMANFGNRVKPGGTYKYTTVSGSMIDKEYQSFSPPTVFKVSAAFEPLVSGQNKITCVTQLNHPTDNAENISIGAEYSMSEILFLRGGYLLNSDVENFSLGAGLKLDIKAAKGSFDYAYTSMRDLGGISVFSIGLEF